MAKPIRISLSEEDFRTLVSGQIVQQDGVEIALKDIGYVRMLEIIDLQSF